VTRLGGKEVELGPRCAVYEGYNLHANVSLGARERGALERLWRYILRPPLAVKRLERLPDGRVRLGMKRMWSDGTAAVKFSAQEFTERLAALVPPPRANQVLYCPIPPIPPTPGRGHPTKRARIPRRSTGRASWDGVAPVAPPRRGSGLGRGCGCRPDSRVSGPGCASARGSGCCIGRALTANWSSRAPAPVPGGTATTGDPER